VRSSLRASILFVASCLQLEGAPVTLAITFKSSVVADWYYVSQHPSQVAEWYYFTDIPSKVAKWIYFTDDRNAADVILTPELGADVPWLYISDQSSRVASWIYISETPSKVAEWVYITNSPKAADVTIYTTSGEMRAHKVIACVLEHLKKKSDEQE
jgi:hypothetical protein